jgi:nitrite reductase/ring-hydroxylating ferredoxin subunit
LGERQDARRPSSELFKAALCSPWAASAISSRTGNCVEDPAWSATQSV